MKNKHIFKLNLIYFIAITLVAIVFLLGSFGIIKNDILSSFLIQIVVMLAIPLLLHKFMFKQSFKDTFKLAGFKRFTGKMFGLCLILGVILYFLNSFIATFSQNIITLFGYESISSKQTVIIDYSLLFKEFVLSSILPALCEEFLHRGIMFFSMKEHKNPRICMLTSSILFGLIHLNINQFFYATILGFLMCYLDFVSDSIYPSIIAHFMNNFLSNYFYYGYYLKFPLALIVAEIRSVFTSNVFIFILSSTLCIILLIYSFKYFAKKLAIERAKVNFKQAINDMSLNNESIEVAQSKINQMNNILQNLLINSKSNPKKKQKLIFTDNIFLISSFILGTLVTISSFIWGII